MRFGKTAGIFAALVVLLFNLGLVEAAEQLVTGRLLFENNGFTCDQQCKVTLLTSGVQPIQTVFADVSGHFTFNGIPRGPYSIRVEIEGFEPVTQPVDTFYAGREMTIIVPLVRKRVTATTGSGIVNISEFTERYPKKAVSFFEKGMESLRKKKNDEAIKYLRQAVELAPTFYEAHNQLGLAYVNAGRMDEAEQEFVKAHDLNSTSVDPLLNLTTLYLDENQPERAVTAGEQAVKANSRSAPAFFSLGVALYKAAQLDRAEAALKRALDLAPKMANIRLMLANVYMKLRRYDNTLEQLNSYIAENPRGRELDAVLKMRDQLLEARASERP
jgi:tetratricopeptide (TPR) repeat protein